MHERHHILSFHSTLSTSSQMCMWSIQIGFFSVCILLSCSCMQTRCGHLSAATKYCALAHKLLSLSRAHSCWAICAALSLKDKLSRAIAAECNRRTYENILTRSSTTWLSKNNKSIACLLPPHVHLCDQKTRIFLF